MNGDLISRKEAITAIQKAYADTEGGTDRCAVWKNVGLTNALHIMQDLPSGQTEKMQLSKEDATKDATFDCISRQSAIDAIRAKDDYSNVAVALGLGKAMNAICELPSVQPQRWIPVSEALPEYDFTDVLICIHDVRHGCENDYYIEQAYTVRGHWKPTLDINMDDLDVVAWMPLPPSYKGGQE